MSGDVGRDHRRERLSSRDVGARRTGSEAGKERDQRGEEPATGVDAWPLHVLLLEDVQGPEVPGHFRRTIFLDSVSPSVASWKKYTPAGTGTPSSSRPSQANSCRPASGRSTKR